MFNPDESFGSSGWLAILSALLACLLYGTAINLTVNNLQGVSGLTITAGGLFVSSLVLLPLLFGQGQRCCLSETFGGVFLLWVSFVQVLVLLCFID